MALSWAPSENRLSWEFALRPNVKFHNGEVITAETVVQSLQKAQAKPGPLAKAPIEAIEVVEPLKIRIKLKEVFNPLVATLAHYSTMILAPQSYNDQGNVTQVIGTGAYQVETVTPPNLLRTKAFQGYWGGKPHIEQAAYLTGHRAESRALQIKNGQAHIIYTLDPASLNLLNKDPNVTVHSDLIPRSISLKLNSAHPYLNSVEARRALSLAIDRTGIANVIIRVPNSDANQLIPSPLKDWYIADLPKTERNLPEAQALLAKLGWKKGKDGILSKDDKPFELTLLTYADRPELTVVATAIQAQWAELGVKLNISVTNSSSIPAGHADNSLQVALIARNYGLVPDPLSTMLSDFGSEKGGDWGAMNWSNAEVIKRLDQLKTETDRDAYHASAQAVARILADELPLIPVTFYTQQTAVSHKVKGFKFDPFENSYFISEMELTP